MSKKNQETAIVKAPTAAIDRFSDDFQNYLVNLGLPATNVLAALGRSCSKSFRTCSWSGRMGEIDHGRYRASTEHRPESREVIFSLSPARAPSTRA
jgi:hypothetical protein